MKKESPVGKKGYTGNPNGRPPKGEALTDVLRSKVNKEAIAERLIEIAMEKGDIAALKYIYDRIDGRPVETVNQNIKEIPEYVGFIDSRNTEDTEAD